MILMIKHKIYDIFFSVVQCGLIQKIIYLKSKYHTRVVAKNPQKNFKIPLKCEICVMLLKWAKSDGNSMTYMTLIRRHGSWVIFIYLIFRRRMAEAFIYVCCTHAAGPAGPVPSRPASSQHVYLRPLGH